LPTLGNGKIKIETWGEVYIVVRKTISHSDWLSFSSCLSAIGGTSVVAGVACASVVAGVVAGTSVIACASVVAGIVAGTSVIAGVVVLPGKQDNSVVLLVMPLKK